MEIKPPSKKIFVTSSYVPLIPRPTENISVGYFNGVSCLVKDPESMILLYETGFYGKGNLSKSFPNFNICYDDFPEFLHQQQWLNRKKQSLSIHERSVPRSQVRKRNLAEKSILNFVDCSKKQRKLINLDTLNCVPYLTNNIPNWGCDDDMSGDNGDSVHFQNMVEEKLLSGNIYEDSNVRNKNDEENVVVVDGLDSTRLENHTGAPKENLHLNLQESFFLAGVIGVLHVFDQLGKRLTVDDMWLLFQRVEPEFIKRYVVYHWYRAKGWVVRCGLIYGGDFVLYKKGPPYYHSSYVVRVLDVQSKLNWSELASLSRLCETVQKDVVYCTVVPPDDLKSDDVKNPNVIKRFKILEVMHRRWIPTHHLNPKENAV